MQEFFDFFLLHKYSNVIGLTEPSAFMQIEIGNLVGSINKSYLTCCKFKENTFRPKLFLFCRQHLKWPTMICVWNDTVGNPFSHIFFSLLFNVFWNAVPVFSIQIFFPYLTRENVETRKSSTVSAKILIVWSQIFDLQIVIEF